MIGVAGGTRASDVAMLAAPAVSGGTKASGLHRSFARRYKPRKRDGTKPLSGIAGVVPSIDNAEATEEGRMEDAAAQGF